MASTDVAVEVTAVTEVSQEIPESTDETMKLSNDPDLEQAIVTVETDNGDLHGATQTEEQVSDTPDIGTGKAPKRESLTFKDSVINVSYEIQPCSSKRGRDKLIDSLGFTYNCKPIKNTKTVTWTCSVRNSSLRCPATVLQRGDVFLRGAKKHQHLLGQSQPKPDSEAEFKRQMKMKAKKMGYYMRVNKNKRGTYKGNEDFRIIKNGSKAGMDLLRDCLGYTYTFKRATAGGRKTFWNCSVRNKHLHCSATIIQHGEDTFIEGPHEHKHLPAYNIPAEPHEVIPSLRKLREAREDDDDEEEEEESDVEQEDEDIEHSRSDKVKKEEGETTSRSTPRQSGSTYLHSGKASAEKQKVAVAKERKRREHETFLGPLCTINLSKCENPECNCGQVHCPFCDPAHFKPTKAGRVQDHLELTHFAHGVQYDDLMIVKCFKDCDVDKTFGHYHCVFCSQQIIKRDFYARHMLRHLRSMGIPERLLMLPDSKYPDIINAYGYEIPICKKTTCLPSKEKHYHCPVCSQVCLQRSLTVNHLWRCLQKQQGNTEDISDGDETQMYNMVDETQVLLHFSHVKSINDLPVKMCRLENCCGGMYHCPLCPEDLFIPSYKQQLLVHYITHWKHRVNYKNYGLLRCYLACQGFTRTPNKVKYHYHCPICTKIIQSKGTFEDHLKSCHMLRFGENLIESNLNLDDSLDDVATEDPAAIQERVEFLEDQLIAQSKAYYQKKVTERKQIKREREESMRKTPSMYRRPDIKQELVKKEERLDEKSNQSDWNGEIKDAVDTTGPISEKEIFQNCTAILSARCIQTVWSRNDLQSVLGDVAGQTETNLALNSDGQYQLAGTVANLHEAQTLIAKAINKGEMKEEKPESKIQVKPKPAENTYVGRQTMRKRTLKAPTRLYGQAIKKPCKALAKKVLTASLKKGRIGLKRLPQKSDKFPYSEIKEIIKATAGKNNLKGKLDAKQPQTSTVSRGRGRPPKSESPRLPETPSNVKRGRGRPPKKTPTYSTSRRSIDNEQIGEDLKVSSPKAEQNSKQKDFSEKRDESLSETSTPKRYGTRGLRKDYAGMNSGIGIMDIKVEPDIELVVNCSLKDRGQSDVTPSRKRKKEKFESKSVSKKIKLSVSDNTLHAKSETENKKNVQRISVSKEDDETVMKADNKSKSSADEEDKEHGKFGLDNNKDSKVGLGDKDSKVGSGDNKAGSDDNRHSKLESGDNKDNKEGSGDKKDSKVGSGYRVGSDDNKQGKVGSDNKDSKVESDDNKHCKEGPDDNRHSTEGSDDNTHSKVGSDDEKHGKVGSDDNKDSNVRSDVNKHRVRSAELAEAKSPKKQVNSDQSNNFVDTKSRTIDIKPTDFGVKVFVPPTSIMNKDMTGQIVPVSTKPQENKLKFQCSYCSKQFAYKSNLDDHENKHTGVTPYSCEICSKAFPSQSMLMKHKTVVHVALRPFKCNVCHKSFRFMNVLQSHMATHTKPKSHLCSSCDKIFSTAATLKFHQERCRKIKKPSFTVVSSKDNIVIYTDQTTVTAPILEQTEIQYTVQDKQLVQESATTTTPSLPVDVNTEHMYEETTVETEDTSEQLDEVELYACSECNTAFDTYEKAETHILTAHSVVAE